MLGMYIFGGLIIAGIVALIVYRIKLGREDRIKPQGR